MKKYFILTPIMFFTFLMRSTDVLGAFCADCVSCGYGQYLPSGASSCSTCLEGYYCDIFGSSSAQAMKACPSEYNSSDAGAMTNTECYKECSLSNFPHATAVTGNDYYGTSADTCVITSCDSGYSVNSGVNLAAEIGMRKNGTGYGYIKHDGTFGYNGTPTTQSAYGITGNDTWGVVYTQGGQITGKAVCSTTGGTSAWDVSTPEQITTSDNVTADWDNGKYCWCQIDSYTPNGGTKQSLSAPWVYFTSKGSASGCSSECASTCGSYLYSGSASYSPFGFIKLRNVVFGSIDTAMECVSTGITVRWGDKDGNLFESTTCNYGGALTTPTSAPTAPRGYHFVGWTFN